MARLFQISQVSNRFISLMGAASISGSESLLSEWSVDVRRWPGLGGLEQTHKVTSLVIAGKLVICVSDGRS
jgi:hypothetical protein